MFLSGYIAGLHFVQALANPRPDEPRLASGWDGGGGGSERARGESSRIVSVGRTDDGELEVLDHETLDEAYDHCAVMLFSYAVVVHVDGDVFHFEVMRPDMPDDLLGSIEMRVVVTGGNVTTSTPLVEGDDFDAETFFDGFVAGLDAEEHRFKVSFGVLDTMNMMIEQAVAKEIR